MIHLTIVPVVGSLCGRIIEVIRKSVGLLQQRVGQFTTLIFSYTLSGKAVNFILKPLNSRKVIVRSGLISVLTNTVRISYVT